MANFATHAGVAATLGSSLATLVVVTSDLTLLEGFLLFLFFVGGTLLPDIDVDKARPVRWLFNIFAVIAALFAIALVHPEPESHFAWQSQEPSLPGWPVLVAACIAWLLTRYPLAWLFQHFTRHRGLAHSLVIGLLWSLSWVYLALQYLALEELLVWFLGIALLLGFILHLLLDELYSVDLEGARIKRSFGTALKLYQKDFLLGSLIAALACIFLVWLLPWPKSLVDWMQPWLN